MSACSGFHLVNPSDTGTVTGTGSAGTGSPANSGAALGTVSCAKASMTGSGTDSCTVTLSAAAPSGGFSVTLSSSDTAVTVPATLTVPANATIGTFTANVLSVGVTQNATLTAEAANVSTTFSLQLNANMPTLSVTTSGSPSAYGSAVTLKATISSGPTGPVTFYSGGTSVGTTTLNGTTASLTPSSLTAGSHTITASWSGNSSYGEATSAAITQVVSEATPTISWNTPAAITYGTALSPTQLNASSTVAGSFAYSPAPGTVLTPGAQTLSVTFTPTDTTDYSAATATAQLTVGPSITTQPVSQTVTDGSAATFSVAAAGVPTLTYQWQYLDGTTWKRFGAGTGCNTATLTTFATTAAYNGLQLRVVITDAQGNTATSNAVTLTVAPSITTQPVSQTVTDGSAATFSVAAAGVPTLTYKWQYLDGTAWKGFGAGTGYNTATVTTFATTAAYNGLQLRVVVTDGDGKTATSNAVSLTVNAATPAISWTAPAAITYGTALSATQLDATSTVAGTFAYSPVAGTVLTAGTHTITATFTPTDTTDYKTVTATVGLKVIQAAPSLSWNVPAAITYGTALSATQLNASSTVAGTFAYSPAAGTVLKAGTQTISVTFTPTDSTDYSTATSAVSVSVNAATPVITWNTPAAIAYGTALSATQLDASSTVAGAFAYNPAAGTVLTAGMHTITATFTPTDSTD